VLKDSVPLEGKWGSGEGRIWAESLSTRNAETEVLLCYGESNGWLDGQPAAITRKVGKGRITYVGAWMDTASMAQAAKWLTETSGVKTPLANVPAGVEVSIRHGARGTIYILVNFSRRTRTVKLPMAMTDVLEGGAKNSVTLAEYGVAVLWSQP
jgi:beta-galactosidase